MDHYNQLSLKIRPVEEQDRKEVLELLGHSLSREYLPMMTDEFDRAVIDEYLGFVVIDESSSSEFKNKNGSDDSDNLNNIIDKTGQVVGYLCARAIVETYKLETIAIDQKIRGGGIGSLLVEKLSTVLAENGVRVLNVDTDVTDTEVVRFYLKNKFTVSGLVRDEYLPGVTQIHLSKGLTLI